MKKHLLTSLVFAVSLMVCSVAHADRITVTVAGNGTIGYHGDNGPAKMAELSSPNFVCIDAVHNIYFADQNNTVIRKVTAGTGVITTIAGSGISGADGIDALGAAMSIGSMCCDPSGNIYFVSNGSPLTIRRIDAATNIITTVAGAGASTADGISAASASLPGLNSVCYGSGNLYLVAGNQVKKINVSTGIITTIAGTGTAGLAGDGGPAILALLSLPKYIAADAAGNVYFGDQDAGVSFSERVRKIDAAGIITTCFGGGTGGTLFDCLGPSCMIGGLSGMCCDHDGDVIFNEWSCSCRKWHPATNWVTLIGGDFSMESFVNDTTSAVAYMNNNFGICSDEANNYYIGDRGNNRIRKIIQLTSTPTFAFGEAQTLQFCPGTTTASAISGMLWVTDEDAGQTETWTVVTPPSHGMLGGFPATAISHGVNATTKPAGLTYTPMGFYTGPDLFVVKVSDGTTSNNITINVQVLPAAVVGGPDNVCVASTAAMLPSVTGGIWSTSSLGAYATISSTGVVTGLAPGSDNVLYTVNNGCGVVTITKPITIVVYPNAGTIASAETVCQGATITLAETVTGGVWSSMTPTAASVSPAGVVTGLAGGSAIIHYSVTNSCGTAVASTTIGVSPLPDPGTISGSNDVCTQAMANFSSSAPAGTGVWSASNTNVSISASGLVTGLIAGTSTIIYSATNSCGTVDATKVITVKNCINTTELPEVQYGPSVSIYPNPASATLNVHTEGLPTGTLSITITDVTSRVVLHEEMTNNTSTTKSIDVSSLKDGVYMITIGNDDVHFVNKIVVNK